MALNLPRVAQFFLILAVVLVVTYSLSNFIGLSRGGFSSEEILRLQSFYIVGAAFAVTLICFFLYQYFLVKGDSKYGNSIGFSSLGQFPHAKIMGRFTYVQLIFLSLIVFSALALGNIYLVQQGLGQQTYTGISYLEAQQFTTTDSLIYSTALIPGAENLGAAVLIALALVVLGIIARKTNMSTQTFAILAIIIIPVLMMLFGISNHLLRYRDSEISLTTVAGFWLIGGVLTVLTGAFIVFWMLHIVNNFFFDFSRFFSSEQVILYAVVTVIILIVLYLIIYRNRLLGTKVSKVSAV